MAYDIRRRCFEKGVILELCGREDTVVKIMAAITIPDDILIKGLEIVCEVMAEAVANPIE
jgi:diaminobutyrate-2-oxoglutarate transaminase